MFIGLALYYSKKKGPSIVKDKTTIEEKSK
jgi:hypothetical protein